MWTIFKVFIEFLHYYFCFVFRFFDGESCGILAAWPGIKPSPPALEGKFLTTSCQDSP